jgi:hypothetical protein
LFMSSKGEGKGKRHNLAPPPRPGVDDDDRLQKLEDDPRYFPGAELGKAQKAALGIQGLTGRNTASFDPLSTLVRPAMRIYYGEPRKRYKKDVQSDDVVIVPNFFCEEASFDAYDRLIEELGSLRAQGHSDSSELTYVQHVVSKVCKYLAIEEESRAVRIVWHERKSEGNPFTYESGKKFKSRMSKGHRCMATLAFGSVRDLAFRRTRTDELLFFPQCNGALTCFGRDACLRWQCGMNMSSHASTSHDHISITIMGFTPLVVDETLPLGPSDKSREDPFDGCCDVPCVGISRPSMRVITAPPRPSYTMPVRHDDVIIVPEFFCKENDWDMYYQLLREMRDSQAQGTKKAEWISWHEGAHLLSQNPTGSKMYQHVLDKMCEYFAVAEKNRGTRFNWYRDGSDWKPFHHDSAAFNPQRAQTQNCTIGISFGDSRDLAFRHAKTGELLYFPQKNGMLFYFGRDANIVWQHGINALPEKEQGGKGRISIILWGLCTTAIEEAGSPPMLDNETRDGKGKGKGKGGYDGRRNQACRDHQAGRCSYGDRCRFSHA